MNRLETYAATHAPKKKPLDPLTKKILKHLSHYMTVNATLPWLKRENTRYYKSGQKYIVETEGTHIPAVAVRPEHFGISNEKLEQWFAKAGIVPKKRPKAFKSPPPLYD